MKISDWNTRWENNQIGFHEAQANDCLTTFIDQFQLSPNDTVFVPLCGKSNDLMWLSQQGFNVIGIECSPIAVDDFFSQYQLTPSIKSIEHFKVYTHNNITIYQGDFFKLDKSHLAQCDLIYDRASMVAFSPELRKDYISHLKTWLDENTQLFLITLTYDQSKMQGPPFSVSREEVEQCYNSRHIEQIHQIDAIDEGPKWRKMGLTSFFETAFKIK